MVKSKRTTPPEEKRCSERLAAKLKSAPPQVEKKKQPVKKAPKAKKVKQTENGNKAEEPKAEATDAK